MGREVPDFLWISRYIKPAYLLLKLHALQAVLENDGPLEICGAHVTDALALVFGRNCIIHGGEPQCNNT